MSWPVAHAAFAAHAEPVLARPLRPVAHLGIMSTAADGPAGGSMRRPASTSCSPIDGTRASSTWPGIRGCWGRWKAVPLMTPRTGRAGRPGLARSHPGGRDRHVQHLRLGRTADAAGRAARRGPIPCRAAGREDDRGRAAAGRAGQVRPPRLPGDPEYGIKGLLVRNLEHLRPAQFAKIMDTLGADRHGQEIAAAWIAKEKLPDVLNLRARLTGSVPCERNVRDRLFRFYDWCAQNDDIPELLTLARTISRWEEELVCAVLTGVTNARSERKPEPDRQARSPPGILLPQPREPAPTGSRGLHPRFPATTERRCQSVTLGDRPETRSRLTSKSRKSPGQTRCDGF